MPRRSSHIPFFFLLIRRALISTLFPYTTLFRSLLFGSEIVIVSKFRVSKPGSIREIRSEEHTSELQSRENLVCRLLLEKKYRTHIHVCTHPHIVYCWRTILWRCSGCSEKTIILL